MIIHKIYIQTFLRKNISTSIRPLCILGINWIKKSSMILHLVLINPVFTWEEKKWRINYWREMKISFILLFLLKKLIKNMISWCLRVNMRIKYISTWSWRAFLKEISCSSVWLRVLLMNMCIGKKMWTLEGFLKSSLYRRKCIKWYVLFNLLFF